MINKAMAYFVIASVTMTITLFAPPPTIPTLDFAWKNQKLTTKDVSNTCPPLARSNSGTIPISSPKSPTPLKITHTNNAEKK